MKCRLYLLDETTALSAANLCLINLDVIRESKSLAVRECALITATRQCELLEQYATDVKGWCENVGAIFDTAIEVCANELRSNVQSARRLIEGELN